MKVRGREEPWCTGPGWYKSFTRLDEEWARSVENGVVCYRLYSAGEYLGPYKTQWEAIKASLPEKSRDPSEPFQITPEDIEAES